ncbi:MAG: helix-turn-helix transcriptional regulator [Bacteroidales bacterium]|nr:helix-turn-helix transcriptional regulator [Bacteroidales bacterium]
MALAQTEEVSSSSTVTAVSPEDGSLWVAAPGDGLYRFGRNGRILHYSVGSGHIQNDTIVSLAFDASATLYILDAAGRLTRYSSIEGFSTVPSVEGGVGALSESAGIPYIIRDSLLYSISSGVPEFVRTLPFSVSSGVLPELEYEEEVQPDSSLDKKESTSSGFKLWPVILALLAGLCLGAVLAWLFAAKKAAPQKPAVEVKPVVQKPLVQSTVYPEPVVPEPVVPETPVFEQDSVHEEDSSSMPTDNNIVAALQASEFGRQVLEHVSAHLSDSGYGVEQIAADLGITRIHVNRKLKAETGYSPSTVFKTIRMTQAKRLLLEGRYPVAEIATRCGFSTASYFSTAFKDFFGQSPSEFLISQNKAK